MASLTDAERYGGVVAAQGPDKKRPGKGACPNRERGHPKTLPPQTPVGKWKTDIAEENPKKTTLGGSWLLLCEAMRRIPPNPKLGVISQDLTIHHTLSTEKIALRAVIQKGSSVLGLEVRV